MSITSRRRYLGSNSNDAEVVGRSSRLREAHWCRAAASKLCMFAVSLRTVSKSAARQGEWVGSLAARF